MHTDTHPIANSLVEPAQADRGSGGGHDGQSVRRSASAVKWISIAVILISLVVIARMLPFERAILALRGWFDSLGLLGPIVFAGLYVVATVLFLPGSVLTAAAGVFFGLFWGTAAVSVGSTTGAALAFLIARYLARDAVARKVRRFPRFDAVDRAVGEGGWKIVAMLRLSPAVPFNLQNYLYGLTSIRFWPTVLTSWAAMLPGTVMYVYFGYITREGLAAAAGVDSAQSAARWTLIAVGLAATVGVAVYVTKLAQRKLREQTDIAGNEDASSTPALEEPEAHRPRRPWGVVALGVTALAFAALAACSIVKRDAVAGLFGPPPVTMQESYAAEGESFDHSLFDRLLRQHVDAAGWVDYAGLSDDAEQLDRYLAKIQAAPFDRLGRDEKLAFLVNAYNAFTLRLILDHWNGGKLQSIRDIPSDQRWAAVRLNLAGDVVSLDQIEHKRIRPQFAEPRVHFALVCAAVGCPPLRNEAYVGARLDEQLESQTRFVHAKETWFRYDGASGAVFLTPLYKWYGGDFEQAAGSVLKFAGRYDDALASALDNGNGPRVAWLDYDWRLNDKRNRAPR